MRTRITRLLSLLAPAMVLAACSAPSGGPSLTAEETGDKITALGTSARSVLEDPSLGEFAAFLEGVSPAGLPHSGNDLPRGVYVLDAGTGNWVGTGPSDDLDLNWSVEPGAVPARLLVDWDAASASVRRELTSGEEVELPTGAAITLTVGGVVKADFDQTATWPVNACGTLTEPGDLYLDGQLTHADAVLAFDRVGISVVAQESTATAGATGGLELSAPAGRAWLDWDADLALNVTRDPATCEITDGEVTSGRLQVDAGVDGDGGNGSVGFATDFEVLGDPSAPDGLRLGLSNGRLSLDGSVAVTWNGVLDDANGNGIPGDGLTLTFADGSMTLEEFIVQRFGPFALGLRSFAALR